MLSGAIQQALVQYREHMQQELKNILQYWIDHTMDEVNGGFYGRVGHNNQVHIQAPKGSVLNSRILWAFSGAYNLTGNNEYRQMAHRAYEYFTTHFIDTAYGGVYWSVDATGYPLDTKKQTYATAFAVYALSEYFKCSENPEAREEALALYQDIINHAYDPVDGGYFEAFARDWTEMEDSRLSAKDANEKKSMNTHLHVLEAFANLYSIWPEETLQKDGEALLAIFTKYIIHPETHHLQLFFQEDWKVKSGTVSYGHDVEAAWLLQQAAEMINSENYSTTFKELAIKMVLASKEGLDKDGGLWYEFEPLLNHSIRQKHSWPQAEAMIGFFNAWQITADAAYLQDSINAWEFTQQYIIDHKGGEWVWGVEADYSIMSQEDKVGVWKCPYHNSRACIEIITRIDSILKKEL